MYFLRKTSHHQEGIVSIYWFDQNAMRFSPKIQCIIRNLLQVQYSKLSSTFKTHVKVCNLGPTYVVNLC